jgi:hypothetical protein
MVLQLSVMASSSTSAGRRTLAARVQLVPYFLVFPWPSR